MRQRRSVAGCCLRTDGWEANATARKSEADQLYEFYQLSLALQKHRKDFVSSVPTSMNPEEPHPQYHAGAMAAFLASWNIPEPWSFSLEDARQHAFFSRGYWGVLTWLHALRWAPEADTVAQATIGVSWMEPVLSFMIFHEATLLFTGGMLKGKVPLLGPIRLQRPQPLATLGMKVLHNLPILYSKLCR